MHGVVYVYRTPDDFTGSTAPGAFDLRTVLRGIVVNQSGAKEEGEMDVYTSDPKAEPITVKTSAVKSIEPSTVSQMPEGLADYMDEEELLDLLAFLASRGDPEASVFD